MAALTSGKLSYLLSLSMNNRGKYIGIESRVHYEILEAAICDYLSTGSMDKEKCLAHIKAFTKGTNRAGKILKHLSVFFSRNERLLKYLSSNIDAPLFVQLPQSERKAIVLSLFCNSFPITYDILIGFAQAFKVQKTVSKEVILNKIGAVYGSNRAMHIAVTELLPLLIECQTIQRIKLGMYGPDKRLSVSHQFLSELVIYTDIKLSGSKSILLDALLYKPWYAYFNLAAWSQPKFNHLITKKESAVGNGYLTIC